MLLVLVAGLLAGSLLVLLIKRTRETLLMSAVCLTLTIFLAGVMILISKQGGISRELERALFFSHAVRVWLQYRFITLNQLGLVVSVGRHLFPLCLLEMSLYYSRLSAAANARRLHWLALLCPAASLTAYWPGFYRGLIPPDSGLQAALYYFSYLWAAGYVVLALLLLALELRAIRTPFCRRQFGKTALCLLALSALYLLYCGQDPGQIYRFYSYDYLWIRGAGYLQYTLSVGGYVLLTAGNVICGALALASLLMYTQDTLTARERETGLERRFDVARSGASVFVHSIKNQLLANRVLHKRIRGELQREAPDLEKLRQYVDSLSQNNEQLITRSEELYRTVKSKSVRLFPISLDRLERVALDRFARKHPEGLVESRLDGDIQVLADENYLSEALYNLLANAWEANLEAGRSDRPVLLVCHQERFYTILEVRDQGPGISPAARKHIFEPFYSSKNANFNWGMGLYHTRTIVRSHLGSLRVENNPGGGASFLVVLPRYGGCGGGDMIRVLVAEDFGLLREDLCETLGQQEDMEVAGSAASGREIESLALSTRFDVVLMDIEMETTTAGIRAAERILEKKPEVKVIFLTAHETENMILTSMGAGAVDYIVKGCDEEELLRRIREAAAGHTVLDERVQNLLMKEYTRLRRSERSLLFFITAISQLTTAERELVRLLLEGKKIREIAAARCVEVVTVKTQIKSLLRKFGCTRTREIIDLIQELDVAHLF